MWRAPPPMRYVLAPSLRAAYGKRSFWLWKAIGLGCVMVLPACASALRVRPGLTLNNRVRAKTQCPVSLLLCCPPPGQPD